MPNDNSNYQAKTKFRDNLPHNLTLTGKHTTLEPMQLKHVDDLNVAAADGELWNLTVTTVPTKEGMLALV